MPVAVETAMTAEHDDRLGFAMREQSDSENSHNEQSPRLC